MGNMPWSSARGRPNPRGGHARLSGHGAPPDPRVQDAVRLVSALALAPATDAELRDEPSALADFREVFPMSSTRARRRGERPGMPTSLGARLGMAAAAAALSLGGLSAAALTGSTPGSGDDGARTVVDSATVPLEVEEPHGIGRTGEAAEADRGEHGDLAQRDPERSDEDGRTEREESSSRGAVRPDATGPAAVGRCTASSRAGDSGRAAEQSAALRHLATAAGEEGQVASSCEDVEPPTGTELAAEEADRPGDSGPQKPDHAGAMTHTGADKNSDTGADKDSDTGADKDSDTGADKDSDSETPSGVSSNSAADSAAGADPAADASLSAPHESTSDRRAGSPAGHPAGTAGKTGAQGAHGRG